MSQQLTVIVMAKEPVPGRVKTRLSPHYTPDQAANLAEAALADTLALVAAAPVRRRILCLQGESGPWRPPGFELLPQVQGGLDVRIAAALSAVDGPVLLIGMDTPQLRSRDLRLPGLRRRLTVLAGQGRLGRAGRDHAWFGPAADGGYWALGLTRSDPALVLGVPMSQDDTGRVQLARLRAAGIGVTILRTLRDVDTADDVAPVAALVPGGRFATVAAGLADLTPEPVDGLADTAR